MGVKWGFFVLWALPRIKHRCLLPTSSGSGGRQLVRGRCLVAPRLLLLQPRGPPRLLLRAPLRFQLRHLKGIEMGRETRGNTSAVGKLQRVFLGAQVQGTLSEQSGSEWPGQGGGCGESARVRYYTTSIVSCQAELERELVQGPADCRFCFLLFFLPSAIVISDPRRKELCARVGMKGSRGAMGARDQGTHLRGVHDVGHDTCDTRGKGASIPATLPCTI